MIAVQNTNQVVFVAHRLELTAKALAAQHAAAAVVVHHRLDQLEHQVEVRLRLDVDHVTFDEWQVGFVAAVE